MADESTDRPSAREVLRRMGGGYQGLSLRDRFALKAFEVGFMARTDMFVAQVTSSEDLFLRAAIQAYGYADALMAIRGGPSVRERAEAAMRERGLQDGPPALAGEMDAIETAAAGS